VPHCCGHSAYLAILSFSEREANPGIRNRPANADRHWSRRERRFCGEELRCSRARAAVPEIDSRGETVECVVGWDPLHLHEIGARVADRRIGEVAAEHLVTWEQQETFAVSVESAR
jgi:hypothetical protein